MMIVHRLLFGAFFILGFFIPASSARDYVWTGSAGSSWNAGANWSPAAVPGASSSYEDRMLSNGTLSNPVGNLNGSAGISGLGEARYLKGIRISGVKTAQPGLIYILNSQKELYVHDEGISVSAPEDGGAPADFGLAWLVVAADQSWTVEAGRTLYLGADSAPARGAFHLEAADAQARSVTLRGGGTVRLGRSLPAENIDPGISFVLDNGLGVPALNMEGKALENAVSIPSGGILEKAGGYLGTLETGENASVEWRDSEVLPSSRWNLGSGTSFKLTDSILDQSGDAPFSGEVALSGNARVRGGGGRLLQDIEDQAVVTYEDRTVSKGEIRSLGSGATIILENAALDMGDSFPEVNLVIRGNCTVKGEGTFTGKVTCETGSRLTVDGPLELPDTNTEIVLAAVNIGLVDGIRQNGSVPPVQPGANMKKCVVKFSDGVERYVRGWEGKHEFTVELGEGVETVEVPELPACFTSYSYDAGTHALTFAGNVAVRPPMKEGVAGSRPNIIFILVDDMGWGEVNAFWKQPELNGRTVTRPHSFDTPTLDSMAAEGVQLRRHYTGAPVCAPARASLMLGVHMGHSRVLRNKCFDDPIENSHTLATVLKGAGYDTAAIGKWGIGGSGESSYRRTASPEQRGFDYFYGILDHLSGHCHYLGETMNSGKDPLFGHLYEYDKRDANPAWTNVKSRITASTYDTDLFTARAKQWIKEHQTQSAGNPFFLYLAFPAPHAASAIPPCAYPPGYGLHGGLQWVEKDGMATCNTGSMELAREAGVDMSANGYKKDSYFHPDNSVERIGNSAIERRHATMIRRVDDAVADLIQLLKDMGIDDNTMIVFTSDNGPHHESGADPNRSLGAKNPAYFRAYAMMDGIKKDTWEGGMRVPALVRWPAHISRGQISMQPSQFHDWMATFAEAAGVPVPARCDGVSLLPTLAGVPERQKESRIYVEYFGDLVTSGFGDFLAAHRNAAQDTDMQQVVYVDGFKGVRREGGGTNTNRKLDPEKDFMIFETGTDPQEANNLASSRPDLQEKMKTRALAMRRSSAIQPVGKLDAAYVSPVSLQPEGLRQGLRWRVWKRAFGWVPDFSYLEGPDATGRTAGTNVQVLPSLGAKGVELTGYLDIPADGEYTFYLKTDKGEGSRAFVHLHEMQLIDADFNYTPGEEADSRAVEGVAEDVLAKAGTAGLAAQTVKLKAGLHPIRIGYVGQSADSGLSLQWEGPGLAKQEIPAGAFSYEYVNPVNISKTEETVGSGATTTTLTVQTQLPWTAACDQDWVKISRASGTETAELDIAVEASDQPREREAVVTIRCDGEERTFKLIQTAAPEAEGYEKWKKNNFADGTPEAQMSPDACPAGDGISNLMKYATGLPAMKPCGSVTKLSIREEEGQKHLVLEWPVNREATDVVFSVESSLDLKEWTDEGEVITDGARGEYRDAAAVEESGPARRFLRLKVTR